MRLPQGNPERGELAGVYQLASMLLPAHQVSRRSAKMLFIVQQEADPRYQG